MRERRYYCRVCGYRSDCGGEKWDEDAADPVCPYCSASGDDVEELDKEEEQDE